MELRLSLAMMKALLLLVCLAAGSPPSGFILALRMDAGWHSLPTPHYLATPSASRLPLSSPATARLQPGASTPANAHRRSFLGTWLISVNMPSMAGAATMPQGKEAIDEAASLTRLGVGEQGKQNFDKAFMYYDKALTVSKNYAPAYVNRANIFILRQKLNEALADYDKAASISARPENEKDSERYLIYLNRATTRLALGGDDAQASVDDLNMAQLLRGKGETIILSNRAQAYERLGDYNRAIGDYASAIALSPRDVAPFWLRYASCLFEARRDAEAIALVRRLRQKFTGEAEVGLALAAMLLAAGSPSSSTDALGAGFGGSSDGNNGASVSYFTEATEIYRSLPSIQRQR